MKYLGNAFSIQMLTQEVASIKIEKIGRDEIPSDCMSVIGHQEMADFMGVPMNRVNTKLLEDDVLYVAQYVGGRLPEGTTMLDESQLGKINYYKVSYLK